MSAHCEGGNGALRIAALTIYPRDALIPTSLMPKIFFKQY